MICNQSVLQQPNNKFLLNSGKLPSWNYLGVFTFDSAYYKATACRNHLENHLENRRLCTHIKGSPICGISHVLLGCELISMRRLIPGAGIGAGISRDWRKEDKDIDLNLTTKLLPQLQGAGAGAKHLLGRVASCEAMQEDNNTKFCRLVDTCALSLAGRDLSPDTSNHPQKPRAKPTNPSHMNV